MQFKIAGVDVDFSTDELFDGLKDYDLEVGPVKLTLFLGKNTGEASATVGDWAFNLAFPK